jgi:hypothetical protein
MPDIYETDTSRTGWGGTRETPHISDAPQISPTVQGEHGGHTWRNRLSWGALWAGLATSLLTWLFLNLLGVAFGAASLAPMQAGGGASTAALTTGAGIWLALSSILAGLAGGYAAGKFSGTRDESTAGWHGLITWALSTLALLYLLSSAAGGLLGGLGGLGGSAAQSAAQAAAPGLAAMADPFSTIDQELRTTTAGNDPAALRDAAIASVRAAVTADPTVAPEARERAAQALAKSENISVENARTEVQHYEQQYRQGVDSAKQQAAKTANDAAKAVSRAALLGTISLLLGGLAGWLGGRLAAGDQGSLRERIVTASGRARR